MHDHGTGRTGPTYAQRTAANARQLGADPVGPGGIWEAAILAALEAGEMVSGGIYTTADFTRIGNRRCRSLPTIAMDLAIRRSPLRLVCVSAGRWRVEMREDA
jgi:hypothetical protein